MADSNAQQQTWKQEDLNEHQEVQGNWLAEEFQSGLYLSDQAFNPDSMK